MKNLLSFSSFVEEKFPKKITEEVIKEEIPVPKKEITYNLENLAEVDLLIESAIPAEEIKENIGLMQKKKHRLLLLLLTVLLRGLRFLHLFPRPME